MSILVCRLFSYICISIQTLWLVIIYKIKSLSSLAPIILRELAPVTTQTGWINADLEKAVLPLMPMGKLIQPEDIAETILFLSSEQARMLTGQVIKVSGGHAI